MGCPGCKTPGRAGDGASRVGAPRTCHSLERGRSGRASRLDLVAGGAYARAMEDDLRGRALTKLLRPRMAAGLTRVCVLEAAGTIVRTSLLLGEVTTRARWASRAR